jgi:hypothetical protein
MAVRSIRHGETTMVTRKQQPAPVKKLVWRITEAAPLGEFVDPNAAPSKPAPALPEATVSTGGWVVSSFELLHGADVTEGYDTVPGDLFDQLFAAPAPPPKPPEAG